MSKSFDDSDNLDIFIGIDVDGTVFEHKYPDLGKPVPLAFFYLKKFNLIKGVKLILFTMRSKGHPAGRDTANEAKEELEKHGVRIFAVNENPSQWGWSSSPKVYCHFYIDDAAIGTPLLWPRDGSKPFVDWSKVGPLTIEAITGKIKNRAEYIKKIKGEVAAKKFLMEHGVTS